MHRSPTARARAPQQVSASLPTSRSLPSTVRSKVAIVDGRGFVLAVAGTIAEARAFLAGGAHG